MTRLRLPAVASMVAAAVLALSACTPVRNPVTGQTELSALSTEDEQRLGSSEHPKILQQYGGAYADPKVAAYVQRVGQRLKSVSQLPDQRFTFTVLDTDVVNAFALPGGYVYVTRGLLALANDEAEVAGVLAHEIGHVAARHTAQRMTRAQQSKLGTMVATIATGVLLGSEGARVVGRAGETAGVAWVQGYSRDQEFQADQLGVTYLAAAGYDPGAMATFLASLQANDDLSAAEQGKTAGQAGPEWLASHPRTLDRVERAAEAAGNGSGERRRDAFLAIVDGLLYGDDPSRGIVQGNRFIHPGLGFRFDAPPGFRLRNGATQVVGTAAGERLLLFDAAKGRSRDPYEHLTREWVGERALQDVQRVSVDGRPAAIGRGDAEVQRRRVEALFCVLEAQDGRLWRFVLVEPRLARRSVNELEATVRSFRELTPAEARSIRPQRVQVVVVRRGDTQASLAERMATPGDKLGRFRVLNHLGPSDPLTPGQKVKLIRG